MTDNILGTKKISSLFVKFAIPAVIAMIISGSQSIIDGIFLGNFVGPSALASINIVQPFMQVIIGTSMVISIGSLSIIGRKLGQKHVEEAQDTFRTALVSLVFASLIISVIGVLFSTTIGNLLGADSTLITGVSTYIRIISFFAPIITTMFLFGFTNRVIGNPELYLKSTILSLLCNVTLNYILIKKLNLGVTGAALATGLSYTTAFTATIIPLLKRNKIINIFTGKFNKSIIPPSIANGSSEAVVSVASAITAFLFNSTFMGIAGADGVAAFSTINYLSQLGILVMFGISDGISALLSYNYGFKKYDRVMETLKIALICNIVFGVLLFLILVLFRVPLVSMFIDNKEIIALASQGAVWYSFSFLLCGTNIINSGYFTALGNAKESIIISASRGLIFIILGIVILPRIMGINGIWFTVPFAEIFTFIIGFALIRRKNKELKLS